MTMVKWKVLGVMMMTVAASAMHQQVRVDSSEVLLRIEQRLSGFEELLSRVDLKLQQDSVRLEALGTKVDRLEKVLGNRMLSTQRAAERASNSCQKLGQKSPDLMQQDATAAIGKEATAVTTRMTNMYNDLWRRSLIIEGLLKESLNVTGAGRREARDGLRTVTQAVRRGQYNAEVAVENLGNKIQHSINEVEAKITVKVHNVSAAQDAFSKSCQRIQEDEEQMETNIVKVLDGLMITLGTIMNRTMSTNDRVQKMQELIDSHGVQILKAVKWGNNATMLIRDEHKAFMSSADERRQSHEGLAPYSRKFDTLLTLLQELQEEFSQTMLHYKNHEADPTVLCENLREDLQRLFKENLNKFKDEERDSLVEKLTAAVENLQDLIVHIEDQEDDFDKFEASIEDEAKISTKIQGHVLSPKELIEKLNKINLEKSPEDVSASEHKHKMKHRKMNDDTYDAESLRANQVHHRHHTNDYAEKGDKKKSSSSDEIEMETDDDQKSEYFDDNYINLPPMDGS